MRQAPLPPILCISDGDWDALLPTNRQQLIKRLAAYTPVFVAEAPMSVAGMLLGKSRARRRRHGITIEDGVYIYQPKDWLPYPITRRSASLSRLSDLLLRRDLTHIYTPLDWPRPILWLYPPDSGDLLGVFNECFSVYHCVDNNTAIKRYNRYVRVAPYNERKTEEYLIRHVDLVITTSQPLYERWKKVNANTLLMPNVADTALFAQALEPALPHAPAVAALPHPIIGYFGVIDRYKVDLELLAYLADHLPEASIVCIGPIGHADSTRTNEIPRRPNLHYLQPVPQIQLPPYVAAFDVAIIPYTLNDYTEGIFPLKLYEYLAAGKPVVATNLPALQDLQDVVMLAPTYDAFVASVREAIATDTPEARIARSQRASAENWDNRAHEIVTLLTRKLSRSQQQVIGKR